MFTATLRTEVEREQSLKLLRWAKEFGAEISVSGGECKLLPNLSWESTEILARHWVLLLTGV